MQIDNILGNQTTKDALKTELAAHTLPHAILLAAPAGCGRGFVARCLAADYLFPNGGNAANAIMQGQSPELIVVQGEGKSGQIPVDAVRAARQEIYRSALSSSGRVIWIKDAHRMAAPAANALLKALEEPPEGVLFILTTEDASSLPNTIVSRCTLYSLAPVSKEECQTELEKALLENPSMDPSLAQILTILYDHRIGIGLRILQSQDRLTVMNDAIKAANAAAKQDRYAVLQIFSRYEGRADADRLKREDFLSDFSAVLETGLRGAHIPNIFSFDPFVSAALLPPILEAQQNLRRNVAPKIVFTSLSIHLARAYT